MDFNLSELKDNESFLSRIIRIDEATKVPFLAEKYNDYYISLPKMLSRERTPDDYKELWDICSVIKSLIREYEEVEKMIESPIAKQLIKNVNQAVNNPYVKEEVLSYEEQVAKLARQIDILKKDGYEEGKLEGREEGKLEGREEGREEGKLESALGMLKIGIDKYTVSQALDVPLDWVENIKSINQANRQ